MASDPLAELRATHPEGSSITLRRIDPGRGTKVEREQHTALLEPYVGHAGTVRRWAIGTRGPQVLVWFNEPPTGQWWLWANEVSD